MTRTVPVIYSPRFADPVLTWRGRLTAGAISLACLAVFIVAMALPPSPEGVATHQALGLDACQFLQRTGLPCPSCGMTTSFAEFVRGHFLASFYVQPMGFVLAVLAALTFWAGLYIALTARPAYRALSRLNTSAWVIGLMLFGTAAWAWKILIHLRGLDGWH